MKSLQLISKGIIKEIEKQIPVAGIGEKLLRITSVGICGSDLHWFSEGGIGDSKLAAPLILGHEFCAITEEGIRVAVDPASSCMKCEFCLQGNPNLCREVRFAGHGSIDGALREWMVWDEKCLFPIPDSISNEEGAMLEPLGVAIHAVDLAHLKPGMRVAILGCGPIGLLILQMVILSGAIPVLASDRLEHRSEFAKKLGARNTLTVTDAIDGQVLHNILGNRGVDVAFEVAGNQKAVDDAFNAVAHGGKVILVGIPENDSTNFSASIARRKGLTIKLVRRMKHTYPRAIELVSSKKIDVNCLITNKFSLSKAQEAFETAKRREGLKVIINI